MRYTPGLHLRNDSVIRVTDPGPGEDLVVDEIGPIDDPWTESQLTDVELPEFSRLHSDWLCDRRDAQKWGRVA